MQGANCVRTFLSSVEIGGRPQVAPTGRALLYVGLIFTIPPPHMRSAPFTQGRLYLCTNYNLYRTVGAALAPVRNPQKSVATVSRREGVYNRAGEPSVIFAEKEELHSE